MHHHINLSQQCKNRKLSRYIGRPQLFIIIIIVSLNGERPVVLFHGGPGDAVAVQFVERNGRLVGK